jgi:hypothetical protein
VRVEWIQKLSAAWPTLPARHPTPLFLAHTLTVSPKRRGGCRLLADSLQLGNFSSTATVVGVLSGRDGRVGAGKKIAVLKFENELVKDLTACRVRGGLDGRTEVGDVLGFLPIIHGLKLLVQDGGDDAPKAFRVG